MCQTLIIDLALYMKFRMSVSQRGNRTANPAGLPPILTDGTAKKSQKHLSTDMKQRLSSYSMASRTSHKNSRPVSLVFPIFNSSLPYAVVRDFAYPTAHSLHYGPQPSSPRPSSPPVKIDDFPTCTLPPGKVYSHSGLPDRGRQSRPRAPNNSRQWPLATGRRTVKMKIYTAPLSPRGIGSTSQAMAIKGEGGVRAKVVATELG